MDLVSCRRARRIELLLLGHLEVTSSSRCFRDQWTHLSFFVPFFLSPQFGHRRHGSLRRTRIPKSFRYNVKWISPEGMSRQSSN